MIFKLSEAISIFDIVINILLVLFITNFIQKNQVNSRTLKDYYIKEIEKVHNEVILYLDKLEGRIQPQDVTKWFISKVAMINNISSIIDSNYIIDSNELVRDLINLQSIVENDNSFTNNFRRNRTTRLTNNTVDEIRIFRAQKVRNFHNVVTKINGYNKSIFFKRWASF